MFLSDFMRDATNSRSLFSALLGFMESVRIILISKISPRKMIDGFIVLVSLSL